MSASRRPGSWSCCRSRTTRPCLDCYRAGQPVIISDILAERLRVTPDEAFVTLRRYARDHNHPLTQLSGDVIRGTARITGDG